MQPPLIRKSIGSAAGLMVLYLVLIVCSGLDPIPWGLIFHFVMGWVFYLARVVPLIRVRWELVCSAAVYVIALLVGSHYFLRWVYREMHKPTDDSPTVALIRWRWRWTLGGFLVIVLMFTSGMAAIGVAHQTAWLAMSPEPMFEHRGRERANRIKCAANLNSLGNGLLLYAQDHQGHYPDDLAILLQSEGDYLTPQHCVCPSGTAEALPPGTSSEEMAAKLKLTRYCSYVYLGKGLVQPVDPSRVVAIESRINHQHRGANVLFGDGHVEFMDDATVAALCTQLRLPSEDKPNYWKATTWPATQPATSTTQP